MKDEHIGKFISKLMKQQKISREELASKINVSTNKIKKFEQGNLNGNIDKVFLLCEELNVSIIFMDDVNYSDSDNLHIYSFKDYLKKHPNYYSVDRVHLSSEGNLALANFIQEKIKATK